MSFMSVHFIQKVFPTGTNVGLLELWRVITFPGVRETRDMMDGEWGTQKK